MLINITIDKAWKIKPNLSLETVHLFATLKYTKQKL